MVYHKQHLEFKEWLSKIPATGNSVLFKNYLNSIYVYWKKEYLKFKNLTLQGFLCCFGLHFTGAGLPSLARRARVPTDSATLIFPIICHSHLFYTMSCKYRVNFGALRHLQLSMTHFCVKN